MASRSLISQLISMDAYNGRQQVQSAQIARRLAKFFQVLGVAAVFYVAAILALSVQTGIVQF
jgi:ABC-type amino acid transport system permease subunit